MPYHCVAGIPIRLWTWFLYGQALLHWLYGRQVRAEKRLQSLALWANKDDGTGRKRWRRRTETRKGDLKFLDVLLGKKKVYSRRLSGQDTSACGT